MLYFAAAAQLLHVVTHKTRRLGTDGWLFHGANPSHYLNCVAYTNYSHHTEHSPLTADEQDGEWYPCIILNIAEHPYHGGCVPYYDVHRAIQGSKPTCIHTSRLFAPAGEYRAMHGSRVLSVSQTETPSLENAPVMKTHLEAMD